MFLFLFFGAFQIVLLYLFGQSIIAVDMFLNLATTNSSEAMELLGNLTPAVVVVVDTVCTGIGVGEWSQSSEEAECLSAEFIRKRT